MTDTAVRTLSSGSEHRKPSRPVEQEAERAEGTNRAMKIQGGEGADGATELPEVDGVVEGVIKQMVLSVAANFSSTPQGIAPPKSVKSNLNS